MESGRRRFLGMMVAAVAALAGARLRRGDAGPVARAAADAQPRTRPLPGGWGEARHWRKI